MKIYVVIQTRLEKPRDVDYFEFQGVFSSPERAKAACRNDTYEVWEEDLDVELPDETFPKAQSERCRVYTEQFSPSIRVRDTLARYEEQGFHGGEPNEDGSFTTDTWKVDPTQRKKYYPAACSAEWYHDSARLWAVVDDLSRQDADEVVVDEIRRMARRAYELGYRWQRGALTGLPEYEPWQEELSEESTSGDSSTRLSTIES